MGELGREFLASPPTRGGVADGLVLCSVSERWERGVSALLVQRNVSIPGRFEDEVEQVLA